MNVPSALTIILSCLALSVNCVRILSIFPHQAKSHYNVYEPLLKRLAEKGHQVVSLTHFPQKTPLSNFTDLDVSSRLPSLMDTIPASNFSKRYTFSKMKSMLRLCGVAICDPVLSDPGLQKILRSKEKFDVCIVELFASDCFLSIAHVLNVPIVVGAISSVSLPWTNEIVRNPENPSYIPNWGGSLTDRMNFFERSINFLDYFITKLAYSYMSDKPSYEITRKHFGDDLPDFGTMRSKISLILTNGHPAVSTPRALAPGFKELGGIHIPPSGPQPLPKYLQDFLDSRGKDGVVYFSLGSQLDSSTLSKQVFAAFYRAFEQMPQQILWKCSKGKMPTLPKNVKCIEWAPQLSVLCHPNVRLFITHGGLLGSQEAVYCGVPILGLPLFGDQHLNMAYFVQKGLALQLNYHQLSYEPVSKALNDLLVNKSYTESARKASSQFRDRLIPPLEEAVYWIEYLLRHGPDALKTAASDLTWYQYLLLDVIAVMTISVLLIIWIMYTLLKLLFRRKRTVLLAGDKKQK